MRPSSNHAAARLAAPLLATILVVAAGFGLLIATSSLPVLDLPALHWRTLAALAAIGAALHVLRRLPLRRAAVVAPEAIAPLEPLDGLQAAFDRLMTPAGAPDARRLADLVLRQAIGHEASDVHLVPYESFCDVRFRLDGAMTQVARLPAGALARVTGRLKVLSALPPYVRHRSQDGRFTVDCDFRRVDVRAAFMPTLHGERVALRVLERADVERGLSSLGLTADQNRRLEAALRRPQGLVVVTGPAGCGKTTTLYCALRSIAEHSRGERSVCTLEDPVEYDLAAINQTAVGEATDLTFASGLRNMLRQDPDVIMVGEVRDLETARAAIEAGLTGHLILTTVHAKRAATVFLRLVELGIDPRSVASSVTAVVAQRLFRRLCPHCRVPEPPTPAQREALGDALGDHTYYRPAGCRRCNMKGYLGRQGVFELLEVDDGIRSLVAAGASPESVQRRAIQGGLTTLLDHGLQCAQQGRTSLSEILRVAPPTEITEATG